MKKQETATVETATAETGNVSEVSVSPVIACLQAELHEAMTIKDFASCMVIQSRIDTITGFLQAITDCETMLETAMSVKDFGLCAILQSRINFMELNEEDKQAEIAACMPVKPIACIASGKVAGIRKTIQSEIELTGKSLAEKLESVKSLNSQASYKSFLVAGSTLAELTALNATLNTSNGTEANIKMYIQFFEGKRGKQPNQLYKNVSTNGVYMIQAI